MHVRYAAVDAFVLPTHRRAGWHGWGLPILEAMLMELTLPVFLTDWGSRAGKFPPSHTFMSLVVQIILVVAIGIGVLFRMGFTTVFVTESTTEQIWEKKPFVSQFIFAQLRVC